MAKQTFMARVKAYRKLHPRTSQVEAMKKLAGKKKVAGKKVAGPKKTAPKKKSVTETKKITVVGAVKRRSSVPVNSLYRSGMTVIKKINSMEAKLKKTRNKDERKLLISLINSEHDKLDLIQKQAKKTA